MRLVSGWRRWGVLALLLVGCGAYSAVRIWLAAIHPAGVWQDSLDYHAVSLHGWWTGKLWWGARAPGVPMVLKMAGSYRTFGIVESVLGAGAWSTLALSTARLVRPDWRSVVMGWGVLAFAMTPLVVQWDWSVLSESLSLSAAAVASAAVLWLIRRFTWPRLAILGSSVLFYLALRDADTWEVLAIGAVLVGTGVYKTLEGSSFSVRGVVSAVRSKWSQTRTWLLVGTAVLMAGWVAEASAVHAHRNVVNVENVMFVRVFPYPTRVAWFAGHGMPDAALVDQQARQTPSPSDKGDAKVVAVDLDAPASAQLKNWFQTRAPTTYVLFLFTHPGYVLSAPFQSPRLTYNDAGGDLGFYAPDQGQGLAVMQDIFVPNRFVVVGLAALAGAFAFVRRLYRRPDWRYLATLALVGLGSMLISWHGDGQEVTRHMVEGDVLVRLAVLLLLLVGVLGMVSAPRQLSAGAPADEPVPLWVSPPELDRIGVGKSDTAPS